MPTSAFTTTLHKRLDSIVLACEQYKKWLTAAGAHSAWQNTVIIFAPGQLSITKTEVREGTICPAYTPDSERVTRHTTPPVESHCSNRYQTVPAKTHCLAGNFLQPVSAQKTGAGRHAHNSHQNACPIPSRQRASSAYVLCFWLCQTRLIKSAGGIAWKYSTI